MTSHKRSINRISSNDSIVRINEDSYNNLQSMHTKPSRDIQ